MTCPFGPTGSICFMPPYRLPIPAAMTTNTGLFIFCYLLHKCVFSAPLYSKRRAATSVGLQRENFHGFCDLGVLE